MLSTNSILSLDQGKLFPKPMSEDEFYARFIPKHAPAKAEKELRLWGFLRDQWSFFSARTAK